MDSDGSTPDLASILRTLNRIKEQSAQQHNQSSQLPAQTAPSIQHVQSNPYLQQVSYPPAQFPPTPPQGYPPVTQQWHSAPQGHMNPAPQPAQPARILIDPATIVDWSSGLKCVMRIVAKHEGMLNDIRKMLKVQHDNEKQWFNGRRALIERQAARKEGQKKIDEVLKLVGGTTTSGTSNVSPEELAHELKTYDMKVYKAQEHMHAEFTAKLKRLGVPFFGTNRELIRKVGLEKLNDEDGSTTPRYEKGTIDEAELLKLQEKMIKILMDLCAD